MIATFLITIFALFGASVGSNLYTPTPRYGPTPVPHYSPSPSPAYGPHGYSTPYGYTPAPLYGHHGSAAPLRETYGPPSCSKNSTNTWCLMDYDYPTYEIQHAVEYHYAAVAALYKDVIANTENSIDRLKDLRDETYLCPSSTDYVMPLRAINSQGKWRIIVNNVKAHYETLSQTVRVEQCSSQGSPCPLVPECYETKCVQKSLYHRFLTYDPYDYYFPFAIESFKLPASCACTSGTFAEHQSTPYYIPHTK
eukprot:TRINITY_DN4793_c0_g1_i1.p1 TRINITY_DN4793_c0_g1~~TRINITY_DN4793_c0_g1_i1.p1  ORF type:complete len:252 (-),score=62.71 TRINITY_DN4793_c0_g1_i1:581-1336(-)